MQLAEYNDVIMGAIASQITSLTIAYSTFYSDADQRKHQSSVSLAFARGIHRGPVNSPHKWPVTQKMFPFDDVIMWFLHFVGWQDNTRLCVWGSIKSETMAINYSDSPYEGKRCGCSIPFCWQEKGWISVLHQHSLPNILDKVINSLVGIFKLWNLCTMWTKWPFGTMQWIISRRWKDLFVTWCVHK